jgi:hypothetical protein
MFQRFAERARCYPDDAGCKLRYDSAIFSNFHSDEMMLLKMRLSPRTAAEVSSVKVSIGVLTWKVIACFVLEHEAGLSHPTTAKPRPGPYDTLEAFRLRN